jgi:hypothetical protein
MTPAGATVFVHYRADGESLLVSNFASMKTTEPRVIF